MMTQEWAVGIFLIFIFLFLATTEIAKIYIKRKSFNKAFHDFNFERINPISKETFLEFYRFDYIQDPFVGTYSSYRESNHRDGDELIENSSRDVKDRIISHLGIHSQKKAIISLGYNFKKRDNLLAFVTILKNCTDEGTCLSFPINNEWFIFERTNDSANMSFKKNIIL